LSIILRANPSRTPFLLPKKKNPTKMAVTRRPSKSKKDENVLIVIIGRERLLRPRAVMTKNGDLATLMKTNLTTKKKLV